MGDAPTRDVETAITQGVVLVLTAAAAFTDLRTGRIPNWITLPAIVLAPIGHLAVYGLVGGGLSVVGILVCGAVPLFLFYRGAMGGGDVKLFAAIGAVLGPGAALEVQFVTLMVAALFALGMLAYRGTLFSTLGNACMLVAGPFLPERLRRTRSPELTSTLRIGLAIFVGTIVAVIASRTGGLL